MGIFDKVKNQAKNLAQNDPKLANQAGEAANKATGGRFENQINEGVQMAQDSFGQQGQGGYDDQNQDQNQGGFGGQQGQGQQGQGQGQGQSGQGQSGQQGQGQGQSGQGGYDDQNQNQGNY
ncbi:MAG TPA: hypothetical protein VGG75_28885 [Trebonia sp.]